MSVDELAQAIVDSAHEHGISPEDMVEKALARYYQLENEELDSGECELNLDNLLPMLEARIAELKEED